MLESDFRILRPLEVWHAGRRVDVSGARQRALLSVLLLQAGEVASSDRLIDEVWGDDPPGPAPPPSTTERAQGSWTVLGSDSSASGR